MKGLYEVTVNRGEDIRQVISDYILEKGWEEVFIVGAVGSIIDSAYNAPIDNSIPMNLATNECPGAAELLSFNGEVMKRSGWMKIWQRSIRIKPAPCLSISMPAAPPEKERCTEEAW